MSAAIKTDLRAHGRFLGVCNFGETKLALDTKLVCGTKNHWGFDSKVSFQFFNTKCKMTLSQFQNIWLGD